MHIKCINLKKRKLLKKNVTVSKLDCPANKVSITQQMEMQKENSKEENEEASSTQNSNDYELSDADALTELRDEEIEDLHVDVVVIGICRVKDDG